jgi:D-alanine--poly(phosphoribitol) ligase subunit 1
MFMEEYVYNLSIKFKEVVERFPGKVALQYPDGIGYTFLELDVLSNYFANVLWTQEIRQGDVIAIFNEKSVCGYALMIACLKTGVVYTNLDSSSPWVRLHKIISTSNPKAVFCDEGLSDIFPELENDFPKIKRLPLSKKYAGVMDIVHPPFIDQNFHGNSPAYIMFTSGSTGFPKGAVMSHSNVLHFISWGRQTFEVSSTDIFTNANPIYFDNSVFDFYVSIFNGATLVPLSHSLVKSPKELVQAINASGCTIWFSVPSLLVYLLTTKVLKEIDFPNITRISFGGEGFPKNKLKQLFDLFGHRVTLFNVYGPTECTCICSSYKITKDDFNVMNELAPLGFMAPNFGYEILPTSQENSSLGELALLGPCVGLGYYNDPERTSKSFVQNPKVSFNQLMYKTGDLVERMPNGYLRFRGRVDNQIKHMGYRIELEEIEAAFSTLSYVDEVGVIYEKISTELGQIKAFISVNKSDLDERSISDDIKNIVPSYMVPRKIVVLERLPKNQNGKIDRKQLKEII